MEEIKCAVFSLNKNTTPVPDGFEEVFYHTFQDIVKIDDSSAMLQFLNKGWIMPNYNVSTIVLIPKTNDADSIDKFRPIALSNFKFRVITEILACKLAYLM